MPRKLSTRDVAGDKDSVHPYSRKANQIRRSNLRASKLTHTKTVAREQDVDVMRYTWFQLNLDTSKLSYTPAEMHELILLHIDRNRPERLAIEESLRPGRPRPARLDLIVAQMEADTKLYMTSGMELPDLTTVAGCKALREWDGQRESIAQLRLKRFTAPLPV